MIQRKIILGALLVPIVASLSFAAEEKPVSVHEAMAMVIVPQTQVVWDVSNAALTDDGTASADKLKPEDWDKAKAAADQVTAAFRQMAAANTFVAVAPGQQIMDEDVSGAPKASDVQKLIDANPEGFRQYAKAMADAVAVISVAASKRDIETFYVKSGELDGACEGCHKAYWLKPTASQ